MEVILAVAITLLLSGMMFYVYRDAIVYRDRVREKLELLRSERLLMSLMTAELSSAMEYPFLQTGMEGAYDQACWITVRRPGKAAWAIEGISDQPVSPECDIRMVGYRLRIVEDEETGEEIVVGVEKTLQKNLLATVAEEEGEQLEEDGRAEIAVRLVTDRIRYLRFRYHDGSGWIDSWNEDDLPAAVEITLGDRPLPEGEDEEEYGGEIFRRVVYLPGGRRARGGGVKGLGGSVGG